MPFAFFLHRRHWFFLANAALGAAFVLLRIEPGGALRFRVVGLSGAALFVFSFGVMLAFGKARRLLPWLLVLAGVISASPDAIAASRWERYVNTRYGVVIDYPADLFAPEPPPPDNAGRTFNASAAKASFNVYTHANAFGASRDELQAEDVLDIGDEKPEKLAGENWYAIIAVKDDNVIVRRVLLGEGGAMVHRLEIVYPKTAAKAFQPVVARMMRSFGVDPAIPETAARAADAAGWQSVDTLRLGLKAHGARRTAGLSLEIPRDWQRVPLPEAYQLEFAAPANGADAKLRLLIQAVRAPANVPLAREAEAIKSTIRSGVDDYREHESDIEAALRPARRLTLTFASLDESYPQRNEYLLVRGGETVFTIMVQGPQAKADAIQRVFARILETLGVAE